MKKYHELVKPKSAAWVVLRAKYQKSRGRRPVDCFGSEKNPRRALKAAEQELVDEAKTFFATATPCSRESLENLLGLLGFAALGKTAIREPEAPKKPLYTFAQWGMTIPLNAKTS